MQINDHSPLLDRVSATLDVKGRTALWLMLSLTYSSQTLHNVTEMNSFTWQNVDEAILQSVLRITADAGRCFRVAVGNFLSKNIIITCHSQDWTAYCCNCQIFIINLRLNAHLSLTSPYLSGFIWFCVVQSNSGLVGSLCTNTITLADLNRFL